MHTQIRIRFDTAYDDNDELYYACIVGVVESLQSRYGFIEKNIAVFTDTSEEIVIEKMTRYLLHNGISLKFNFDFN